MKARNENQDVLSARQISRIVGVPESSIVVLGRAMGFRGLPQKPRTPWRVPIRDVAAFFGISVPEIRARLKRMETKNKQR